MQSGLKALLIWLVMMAIPFQGVAAAGMLLCGPSHAPHHPVEPAGVAAADAAEIAPAAHHHAQASAEPTHATHLDQPKCSVCASCCGAPAILNSVAGITATETVSTAITTPIVLAFGFVTDGPERPPRNLLA